MVDDLRAVVDAIGYLTRYGITWRALAAEFPPWPAGCASFARCSRRGTPQRLVDGVRAWLGLAWDRADLTTAAVIDAQSLQTADTVDAVSRGYHGGKKTSLLNLSRFIRLWAHLVNPDVGEVKNGFADPPQG